MKLRRVLAVRAAKLAGALVKPRHCHRIVEQLVVMAASGCPRLAFYHHCVSRQFGVHLDSPISQRPGCGVCPQS